MIPLIPSNLLVQLPVSVVGLLFLFINTYLFISNKNVRQNVSKTFVVYLIALSIIELSCNILGTLFLNSNFFISHFYFLFQFAFLSYLYFSLIENKKIKKLIITLFVILCFYIGFGYLLNKASFWEFNSFEIVSTSLLLILYALFFIFSNLEIKHKYFNFSIGLILYLACSITIFLSGKLELILCENPYIDIWIFNSLFYILFQYFVFREYIFVKNQAKFNE